MLTRLFWFLFRLCKRCWKTVRNLLSIGRARASRSRRIFHTNKSIQQAIQQAKHSHSYYESTAVTLELISLRIEKAPVEILDVTFIKKLNLSSNHFYSTKSLIHILPSLTQLIEFNLSNNKLTTLTSKFWAALPPSVVQLDLQNNQLSDILFDSEEVVFDPSQLRIEKLNLSYNKLTDDGEYSWLFNIPTLNYLDLCQNLLESLEIPKQLKCKSDLEELHIDYNYLEDLPEEFSQFNESLRVLSLSYNEFDQFPSCVLQCRALRELVISRNTIRSIESPTPLGKESPLPLLDCLHIDNNQIRSLPEWVTCLTQLKTLVCKSNQLDNLQNLRDLKSLTYLDFHGNILEQFPEWILENQSLHFINCSFNLFFRLPEEIHTWQRTQNCDLIYLQIPDMVEEGLFIGSVESEESSGSIREHGISHIVQVQQSVVESQRNVTYFNIPVRDDAHADLSPFFAKSFQFIENALAEHRSVLVHSHRGVSRAPAIVIAYLMQKKNQSYEEALAFLKLRRPCVAPHPVFQEQLLQLEHSLSQNNSN